MNAAKGQHRAQRLFAELLSSVETSRKQLNDRWLDKAIEYKVEWDKELRRREKFGVTDEPPPLPHPDHVVIDYDKGTANIVGPVTREEQQMADWLLENRAGFEQDLQDLNTELQAATDPKDRAASEIEIGGVQRILNAIKTLDGL